jgi:hypothetical protein
VSGLILGLTLAYLAAAEAAKHLFYRFFFRLSQVKPAATTRPSIVSEAAP